ncbi:MAG: hypothetical protein WBF23_09875, partial [Methyloceanibacter sp.]
KTAAPVPPASPSSIRPPANHKENGITPPRPDQAPTKSTKSAISRHTANPFGSISWTVRSARNSVVRPVANRGLRTIRWEGTMSLIEWSGVLGNFGQVVGAIRQ